MRFLALQCYQMQSCFFKIPFLWAFSENFLYFSYIVLAEFFTCAPPKLRLKAGYSLKLRASFSFCLCLSHILQKQQKIKMQYTFDFCFLQKLYSSLLYLSRHGFEWTSFATVRKISDKLCERILQTRIQNQRRKSILIW